MAEITTVEQAAQMFLERHNPAEPMATWTQIDRLEQMAARGQEAAPFTAAQLGEIATRVMAALKADETAQTAQTAQTVANEANSPVYTITVDGQVVAGSADRDTAVTLYNAAAWDVMVRRGETTPVTLWQAGTVLAAYPGH